MPVFYFHVVSPDDLMMRDAEGVVLPDRQAALEMGLATAKRHEGYARFGAEFVPGWYVEVTADDGELCWRLRIGETPERTVD
ncbi:DUF6894 family protein [Methylobacterium sp. R2-1]|uniref:DUF6894 family protein n=1 Tax=Methylobacterium sp. R2-1 TaxID=2587064 RepID=UPI0016198F01|nr:hypothetical protein [Methylobacterium sp. R2-1]MBB2961962.1 hypothetical protein [Methylobacterium sp. R2-1]